MSISVALQRRIHRMKRRLVLLFVLVAIMLTTVMLGAAISKLLAARGANIVVNYFNNSVAECQYQNRILFEFRK